MRQTKFTPRTLGTALAVAMALLSPVAVSAQSDLDASQAADFLGAWNVAIESDMGAFTMELELEDQGGKVAASIGVPEMGGPMQEINDIVRSGEGLTLSWEMDAQGQYVDAMMILSRDGDNLSTLLSIADGQFTASGVGTRAGS
jgi:hypothetical protein